MRNRIVHIIFIVILIFTSFTILAQSSQQEDLIRGFFNNRGLKLLKQWGHPGYFDEVKSYDIYIYYNKIKVNINYIGRLADFTTTYEIEVDKYGNFTSLEFDDENLVTPAFDVCDRIRTELATRIEDDARSDSGDIENKIEKAVGKSIGYFTCKDWCLYALYYYWVKDGYYKEY